MIQYNYETNFELSAPFSYSSWVESCLVNYGYELGELNYVFCDDAYLLKLNVEFLQHDTLTDIISFDYTTDRIVSGDIFISVERVQENATELGVSFELELRRVMIHGVLHYMGYKDKSISEKEEMRIEEDSCLKLYK
jgi:rRNA maturation RNase YbeY